MLFADTNKIPLIPGTGSFAEEITAAGKEHIPVADDFITFSCMWGTCCAVSTCPVSVLSDDTHHWVWRARKGLENGHNEEAPWTCAPRRLTEGPHSNTQWVMRTDTAGLVWSGAGWADWVGPSSFQASTAAAPPGFSATMTSHPGDILKGACRIWVTVVVRLVARLRGRLADAKAL